MNGFHFLFLEIAFLAYAHHIIFMKHMKVQISNVIGSNNGLESSYRTSK